MQAGLKFEIIPYKGAAQSIVDVVANHIDFATPTVTSASGQTARRHGDRARRFGRAASARLSRCADLPGA